MILLTILTFGILNAVRGSGFLHRMTMCALMAICIGYVKLGFNIESTLMFIALWAAFIFGWSLSALNGNVDPVTDWEDKFKPSGWILRKLAIKDQFIAGGVGMAIRWLLFIPSIIIARSYDSYDDLSSIALSLIIGILLANAVGGIYYLSGRMLRGTKYGEYATRLSELLSGFCLGGALIA